ncbi:MAG TPA: tetratricopeptide repeat protein [Longimicrobium sp.]|nr:tetratricopeptide repeat protein [Longimicrobium sp.]
MSGRRSPDALPRAPLELAHPLDVQAAGVPGARIAAELPPAEAAPLLQVLRAVLAWTRDPARAAELVDSAALRRLEGDLLRRPFEEGPWAALAVLAGAMAAPHGAEPREVAWACACVAEWGLERRASDTALDFARGAALAWPDHARYAWLIGLIFRGRGHLREAEAWLRRAHRVAVWTDDWEARARSLNSLGLLRWEAGRFAASKELYERAIRAAQRKRLRDVQAIATHNLFVIYAEVGEAEAAEQCAASAFALYDASHPRRLGLVSDVAQHWTNQRCYRRALPIFRALLRRVEDPALRLRIAAGGAHAAGATAGVHEFEGYWSEVERQAEQVEALQVVATALHEAGLGAAHLRSWERAAGAFGRALEAARANNTADVLIKAEEALTHVQLQELPPEIASVAEHGETRAAKALAASFLRTLNPENVESGRGKRSGRSARSAPVLANQ